MNDLNDIVFNPATGLFESKTDATAHLVTPPTRSVSGPRQRRTRTINPARAARKPIIDEFIVEGRHEHKEGSEVCVRWSVSNAQEIIITFHNRRELEYALQGTLRFVMPAEDCTVRILAKNHGVTTQRTISLKSRRLTIFDRLFGRR